MGYHNLRDANGRFVSASAGVRARVVKSSTKKLKIKKVAGLTTPLFETPKVRKTTGKRKDAYYVFVLDDSGSMAGGKADAARSDYNTYVQELRSTQTQVKGKNLNIHTKLWLFSSPNQIVAQTQLRDPYLTPLLTPYGGNGTIKYQQFGNSTALISAICRATEDIEREIRLIHPFGKAGKDYDVVITVFTDGQETEHPQVDSANIGPMIDRLKNEGWTFAFMGLGNERDVRNAAESYGFDKTNTISAMNTSSGVGQTMTMYAKSAGGRNVSYATRGSVDNVGFFSDDK